METTTATDRATELGTEHGRAAAEAWLTMTAERGPTTTVTLPDGDTVIFANRFARPEPDLSGPYTADALFEDCTGVWIEHAEGWLDVVPKIGDAYRAAFHATVGRTLDDQVS